MDVACLSTFECSCIAFFTARTFPCYICSSLADLKQNKHSSHADTNQAKQAAREYTTAQFKLWQLLYGNDPNSEIITLCRRCRRQHTTEASRSPQNTTFQQLFACLAHRLSAFVSRCRTDKAGRDGLERPPEDGARTKRFNREIQVPRILY